MPPVSRGQRPRACTERHLVREPGGPMGTACGGWRRRPCRESLRTYADDERAWEVGQFRSTAEVSEPSRPRGGGGGGGGKGTGQGEPAPAKRAPDAEPERRAQCGGAGT